MNIEKIYPSSTRRTFTLETANQALPLVYHITEAAHQNVKELVNRLQAVRGKNLTLTGELEDQITKEMNKWESKMHRLGVTPKGMWLADFDSGTGYYCWKFPENEIRFWHGYNEGFTGRTEIQ